MEKEKYVYRCEVCDNVINSSEKVESPMCCSKVMVKDPLEPCTTAEHPEMTRNEDQSDACDDGTGKF